MTFADIMDAYFRGERSEALYFIVPVGIVSLAFASALLCSERTAFTWGVAVPFLVLGLALVGVGGAVGLRTDAQVTELRAEYAASKSAFATKELARMRKVNAAWPVYLTTWAAFAVAGLILRFALKSDAANGVGVALVFFAGVGLLIDGFAERRARPYTQALEQLTQGPS